MAEGPLLIIVLPLIPVILFSSPGAPDRHDVKKFKELSFISIFLLDCCHLLSLFPEYFCKYPCNQPDLSPDPDHSHPPGNCLYRNRVPVFDLAFLADGLVLFYIGVVNFARKSALFTGRTAHEDQSFHFVPPSPLKQPYASPFPV